ncbi:MAG: hypothetical protein MPN21_09040 [Thermoanaerobaculia bacterium]|nr:hypothetical protein [Thermoanaerobaculia bacterium]
MKKPRRDRTDLEPLDPFLHQGVQIETERSFDGSREFLESSVTVFLTGAECPFQCVFCDLWRYTLDGPTLPGALPRQLATALKDVEGADRTGLLKLYNASNWFEERAVPERDDLPIAELGADFRRVVVESHARLVGTRCRRFGEALEGRLQVALGVETVHPEALAQLNKGVTLEDLQRAANKLLVWDLEIRTFVLIGAPFVPENESVDWTVRSCELSLELGAVAVSLIPLRPTSPDLVPPTLDQVEEAWMRGRALSSAVQLDVWDLDRMVVDDDSHARVLRLRQEQLELANSKDRP